MKRPVGRFGSRRFVEYVRSQAPAIKLRTTFIVGFPGETEEEFQARMQRAAELEAAQDAVKGNRSKEIAKSKVAGIHERESKRMTHEILPLTPERSEQVRQAFNYMLGVCDGAFQRDGQGFNKPDASVAHCLLTAGLETQQELEAGFMILSRYHRQLSDKFPLIFRKAA